MTSPLGMLDYFAMEASEYVDRLRGLVDADTAPAAAELVRYARALRGAALMANQQPIARAANGLEGVSRAVRDGQREWDAATKAAAHSAVEALAGFVKRTTQWTPADGQAAEQLAKQLEALAGGAATPLRTPASSAATPAESVAASALDAGSRAFLARESALIAAALGQAAAALRSAPPARDALQGVLRRMQPLRGLAALGDLPPLPDLLEAVDRAVAEVGRLPVTPPGAAEVFEAAAKALSRAAQDVTERGLPHADAEESQRFADLTLKTFSTPSGAVSITTLLAEGAEVTAGSPTGPAAAHRVDRVELVSQGEYLVAAADELDRARSITQRDLRLHALAATLRTLGEGAGGRIGDFTSLARDLIGQGVAARGPQEFAAGLRSAGAALQRIPDAGPDQALVDALNGVITKLLALAAEPTAVPPAAVPPAAAKPAGGMPAAPDGLLALATPGSGASGGIAGAFHGYATLKRSITAPAASVDAFIAGVVSRPKPAPRPAPMAAPAPMAVPAPRAAPTPAPAAINADAVVDIKELCYTGKGALDRALDVRKELLEVLANPMRAGGRMRPLLDELLDLVELAQRA